MNDIITTMNDEEMVAWANAASERMREQAKRSKNDADEIKHLQARVEALEIRLAALADAATIFMDYGTNGAEVIAQIAAATEQGESGRCKKCRFPISDGFEYCLEHEPAATEQEKGDE
jgi:hypothetical protein